MSKNTNNNNKQRKRKVKPDKKVDYVGLLNKQHEENKQLKQHIKWILQNELNKSDIPVWRHQYVKSLAEKLGVEIE